MVVTYEKKDKIAIITINRPEVMNALNNYVYRELYQAMGDFGDDDDMYVAILTGVGDKAFSAGADLKRMSRRDRKQHREPRDVERDWYGPVVWKPMIAAINGYCLGGGLELALMCDLRVAAEHARFGLPEVKRGLIPGGGGTQLLPRILPRCFAAEILLMGDHISADDALRMGLVNKVVLLEELMPTAIKWAKVICQNAPLAVKAAKEAMIKGADLPLREALMLEHQLGRHVESSEDFAEGTRAFVEQRIPVWRGK